MARRRSGPASQTSASVPVHAAGAKFLGRGREPDDPAALARYGIPASAPMFIPGFGAFVRLKAYPANQGEDARVACEMVDEELIYAFYDQQIGRLPHFSPDLDEEGALDKFEGSLRATEKDNLATDEADPQVAPGDDHHPLERVRRRRDAAGDRHRPGLRHPARAEIATAPHRRVRPSP